MKLLPGTADKIVSWLRDYAIGASARGYVVGLSGGIDSACTAALCQQAMGDNVLGVLMPCHSTAQDAEMACLLADAFGIQTVTVALEPVYDALLAELPPGTSQLARANIKPRLRMSALYAGRRYRQQERDRRWILYQVWRRWCGCGAPGRTVQSARAPAGQ